MRLDMKGFALASGVLWGLALFVITLVAALRGNGDHISHLSGIYIGYQVSFLGSLIGLVYGFLTGLIAGALFSLVYNGSTKPKGAGF
jgi:mannose/fructose/N-acetylgalactosamine-specific phosphotransferase system component IIC